MIDQRFSTGCLQPPEGLGAGLRGSAWPSPVQGGAVLTEASPEERVGAGVGPPHPSQPHRFHLVGGALVGQERICAAAARMNGGPGLPTAELHPLYPGPCGHGWGSRQLL